MWFWIVVALVVLLVLGLAARFDRRRRAIDNPHGARKDMSTDRAANEARFTERTHDTGDFGGPGL